jgi:hypothetical protein
MEKTVTLAEILDMVTQLSLVDKVRLIERVAPQIEQELLVKPSKPRKSLYGLWSDLGPAPSADEIDQIRREEWANFPRNDI